MSRTGYSVALGCIHRYVGGMASGHHLNSSVSILLALAKDSSSSLVQVCYVSQTFSFFFNRRQNELRHFALKGLFDLFLTSKEENITFPPPSPPCNFVPMFELSLENNKRPNFEWRGQGRSVDSYVVWSYPIWVQCLKNFVADCGHNRDIFHKSIDPSRVFSTFGWDQLAKIPQHG